MSASTQRPEKTPASGRQPRTATALRYDTDTADAPRVTAAGSGYLAERIIALAKANEIPLVQDPDLAQTLARLGLNTEIPPNLYLAVAQVLAYLYRLDAESPPPDRTTAD